VHTTGAIAVTEHRNLPVLSGRRANPYIEADKCLHEWQTVLWFARFPVIRFTKRAPTRSLEISDLRFRKCARPALFIHLPSTFRFRPNSDVQALVKPK